VRRDAHPSAFHALRWWARCIVGGVVKRSELRADPEKVRAWVQRSRDAAIERARGREGQKSTALRRQATPEEYAAVNGHSGKPEKKRRVEASPAFKRNQGPCAMCPPLLATRRRRQAHHVLSQELIRAYVRGLRLPEAQERRLLRKLLSDTRNRIWLCAGPLGCHQQFEGAMLVIPRSKVPWSAFVFAAELGDRYVARLERDYPE
jgi:hypothetical protein